MQHTPGPWTARINDRGIGDADVIHRDDEKYSVICRMYDAMLCKGHGGTAADNARLIAAAPDLLEACKITLENLRPLYPSNHLCIKKLTSVIAKAEGRE